MISEGISGAIWKYQWLICRMKLGIFSKLKRFGMTQIGTSRMGHCHTLTKENPIKDDWTNIPRQSDSNDCDRQSGNVHLKDALGKVCP